MAKKFSPVHPGAFLAELLGELSISQTQLASALGVSAMRVSHLVNGKHAVKAEMALRLGRLVGDGDRGG